MFLLRMSFPPAISILRPTRPTISRIAPVLRQHPRQAVRRSYAKYSHYQAPVQNGYNVVWAFIGVNAAVFAAWQYALPGGLGPFAGTSDYRLARFLQQNFVISTQVFEHGTRWWTAFTSTISHMEIWHFAGNMFSLYAFSSILLARGVSGRTLAALIIGSGLMGSVGTLLNDAGKPLSERRPALGASGSVMGVGAAAALLMPRATMAIYGVIPVPLWMLISAYFAFDAYYLDQANSRIGHAGHLGGLAFGVLYYGLSLRRFGGVLGPRFPGRRF